MVLILILPLYNQVLSINLHLNTLFQSLKYFLSIWKFFSSNFGFFKHLYHFLYSRSIYHIRHYLHKCFDFSACARCSFQGQIYFHPSRQCVCVGHRSFDRLNYSGEWLTHSVWIVILWLYCQDWLLFMWFDREDYYFLLWYCDYLFDWSFCLLDDPTLLWLGRYRCCLLPFDLIVNTFLCHSHTR